MYVVRVRTALLLTAIVANVKERGEAFIIIMLNTISYDLSYVNIFISAFVSVCTWDLIFLL